MFFSRPLQLHVRDPVHHAAVRGHLLHLLSGHPRSKHRVRERTKAERSHENDGTE